MNPLHAHAADYLPRGYASAPVLEAVAKLVPPPCAAGSHRTCALLDKGGVLQVDWYYDPDQGVELSSVWAGPIDLLNSGLLDSSSERVCYTAADEHAAELSAAKRAPTYECPVYDDL